MTIPVSTVPAVKAWLVAQIKAQPACADPVLVCYDDYGQDEPDDMVIVGDVHRSVKAFAMVGDKGAGAFIEDYLVFVTIDCFRGGDDPEGVTDQAWALAAAVETTIRTDPTAGGVLFDSWPESADSEAGWTDDNLGRLVRIVLPLHCQAQL